MSFSRPLFPTSGGQGPTGPQGDAGGNGGLPFYLNYSGLPSPPGIPGTPLLSKEQTTGPGITQTYTTGSTQQFVSALDLSPYTTPRTIPGGIYNLYLYAWCATAGSFDVSFTLQGPTGNFFSSSTAYTVTTTSPSPTPIVLSAVGKAFTLSSTLDQITLTISFSNFITNTSNPQQANVNYEFQNANGYSFLQTTFTPQGPTGTTGPTGSTGPTGPTGTPYWTLSGTSLYPDSTTYNVGIGTISPDPTYKLDVTGSLRATQDATINTLTVGRGGGNVSTNTAVGFSTLISNTGSIGGPTGSNNTAIGYQSLESNTIGDSNTAIGTNALRGNTGGNNNTAIGNASLRDNLSDSNTAIGNASLTLNTTGKNNTAIGSFTLNNNNGDSNTAIGYETLQYNDTASANTSIGVRALRYNTTGYRNVAIGGSALQGPTGVIGVTGNYNVGVGYNSGQSNISGSNNTFLGWNADIDISANRYDNSTALGTKSIITASNQIVIGGLDTIEVKIPYGTLTTAKDIIVNGLNIGLGPQNIPNNINIGTNNLLNTSSNYNIAIGTNLLQSTNNSADNNIALGLQTLQSLTSGHHNAALGTQAGQSLTTGSYNNFFGYAADVDSLQPSLSYSTAIGYGALITKSSQIVLGGIYMGVGATTEVYIPYGDLNINDNCTALSFTTPSDYRIKENVETIYNNSNFTIDNLRPVTYTNILSRKQDIGLIAHELQEQYPFLVIGEKDGPENQSVNYTGLIPILIKEIKELKERVKTLEQNLAQPF
jgi:hypothetical protein